MSWSMRNMPPVVGMLATTRSATWPWSGVTLGRASSLSGIGSPMIAQTARERFVELGHCGAAHLDARVAPGLDVLRRISDPHASDTQAADETDLAIHAQRLAMVATEPSERRIPAQRVVATHLDAPRAQPVPEPARRRPEAAEPVVDQAHAHAVSCLGDERVREHVARRVVVNDVALEMNLSPRGANGVEPCGVVLLRVPEQPNAVSGDQRGPGRPRERLVGERASRREAFGLVGWEGTGAHVSLVYRCASPTSECQARRSASASRGRRRTDCRCGRRSGSHA